MMAKRSIEPVIGDAPDNASELDDESVTSDRLLGGRLHLRQPAAGYRVAIDPVFLAAAVPATPRNRILDAGAGTGAALLCLAARVPECRIAGLEQDKEIAQLARENVAENGFSDRIEIVVGDITAPPPELWAGSYDHVMMNPPYLESTRARPPADVKRAAAMLEGAVELHDWIRFAHAMLRDRGTLTLIHRADRIDQLMAAFRSGFGAVAVLPLWPAARRPAKRVVLRARKGAASPAALLPGLVLHGEDGKFTPAAEAILREGRALDF